MPLHQQKSDKQSTSPLHQLELRVKLGMAIEQYDAGPIPFDGLFLAT
jgi:hypothetical protein